MSAERSRATHELGTPPASPTELTADRLDRNRIVFLTALSFVTVLYAFFPSAKPFELDLIVLWAATVSLLVAVQLPTELVLHRPSFRLSWNLAWLAEKLSSSLHLVLVVSCVVVAIVLRLINLENVSPLIRADEGYLALDALHIARGAKDAPSFFGGGWYAVPTLHMYLEALAINLLGVHLFSVRLVSAIAGIVSVVATYTGGRILVNRRVGLIAAVIATSSPLNLEMSRYSLNLSETEACATFAISFLYSGFRAMSAMNPLVARQQFWTSGLGLRFTLAGVFGGLGTFFYGGSWAILVVFVPISLYALARFRRHQLAAAQGCALTVVSVLIVNMPRLVSSYLAPGSMGSARAFGELFLLSPNRMADAEKNLQLTSPVQVLLEYTWQSFQQFFTRPDQSGFFPFQPGQPVLLGPVAALFGLGLALVILRPSRLSNFVLFIWFWVVLVLGDVIFGGPWPYTPRVVSLLPAVYIMASMGLDWLITSAGELSPAGLGKYLPAIGAVVLVAITFGSIQMYFFRFAADHPTVSRLSVLRFVEQQPAGSQIFSLVDQSGEDLIPYIRFGGYQDTTQEYLNDPSKFASVTPMAGHLVFVFSKKYMSSLDLMRARYPGGASIYVVSPEGTQDYTAYSVDYCPS